MARSGLDSVADRLQKALRGGEGERRKSGGSVGSVVDKKDFEELDLGSPISPLGGSGKSQLGGLSGSGGTTTTTTTTTSSSSSSGSVSGRMVMGPGGGFGRRVETKEHSGELCGSAESSRNGRGSSGGSGSGSGSGSFRAENVGGRGGLGGVQGGNVGGRGGLGGVRGGNVGVGGGSGSVRGENVGGRGGSDSERAGNIRIGGGSGSVRAGHVRSDSGGSHSSYSGGGSVNSPPPNVLPAGNICPSGRVLKTGMMLSKTTKTDVLGSGGVNYGHGSIMRGGVGAKAGGGSDGGKGGSVGGRCGGELINRMRAVSKGNDPEELKRLGNDNYMKGNYSEALGLYNKAIEISPANATLHFNRAASLIGLKWLPQALKELEEAIRLNPSYLRAHRRLGSLFLSLGQVENARRHLTFPGIQVDPNEMQKLQTVEMHIGKCSDARKIHDWGSALRETDAAIASGADSSPQLFACRAEALLKLHRLDDASLSLSDVPKFEAATVSYNQSKFLGMLCEAYILVVRAQIELAQGRFDNAVTIVEKAAQIDPRNPEVTVLLRNMRLVARARSRGNDLFKSERFTEACSAYGEGLKLDSSNSVLYCNRAACLYKLGLWESSIEDCDQALRLQPNYSKALLRRAASYSKLERWAEAVRDYEVLKKEIPYDNEIAEQLFHAQVALLTSRGEDVSNMKFGGEVELVLSFEQFRAAVSSPNASVVLFKAASDAKCKLLSQLLDILCSRYPSVSFLKVDIHETQAIANSENIKIVPTVNIYKSGSRLKEMVCPSPEVLESSVRHYSV